MIRALHRNLLWSTTGHCWALYRVTGDNYGYLPLRVKAGLLDSREGMVKSLPQSAKLMSLVGRDDPRAITEAMVANIDLDRHEQWAERALLSHELFEALGLQKRTNWLAIPLTGRLGAKNLLRQSVAALSTFLDVAPLPIPVEEINAAVDRARRAVAGASGALKLRPAVPAEAAWIYARAASLGSPMEPLIPDPDAPATRYGRLGRDGLRPSGLARVGECRLFDGGTGPARRLPPHRRRWLQTQLADGTESYQAILALAENPADFPFPGSELLGNVDNWFDFPVDWVVDLLTVSREVAVVATNKKIRELGDQAAQLTSAEATGSEQRAMSTPVMEATGSLLEHTARLSRDTGAVEAQPVVLFAVHGDSVEQVEERAEAVRDFLNQQNYQVVRPAGGQDKLWEAMLPEQPQPPILAEYRQYMTARDFAMWMPFTAAEIGDPRGGILGLPLTGGLRQVALIDPSWPPEVNAGGSMGVVGDKGSGKSFSGKKLMDDVSARGGLTFAIDRTPKREWETFALQGCAGRTTIISVDEYVPVSFDPLRVVPGAAGAQLAETFLLLFTDLPQLSPEGVVIVRAVKAVEHLPNRSMAMVLAWLNEQAATSQPAAAAAAKLELIGDKALAKVVFDPELPHLDLSGADNVVFSVHRLVLPTRSDMASERAMDRLSFEKRFGRAMLYLIAAVTLDRAFSSTRFAQVILDEVWYLLNFPEGAALVEQILRDGRKHGTAAWLASQDATAFPDLIRGLLDIRIAMRTLDEGLARAAVHFVGSDPDDIDLVALVRGFSPTTNDPKERAERAGECLYRDARQRIAPLKILPPLIAEVAAAADTQVSYRDEVEDRLEHDVQDDLQDEAIAASLDEFTDGAPTGAAASTPSPVPGPVGDLEDRVPPQPAGPAAPQVKPRSRPPAAGRTRTAADRGTRPARTTKTPAPGESSSLPPLAGSSRLRPARAVADAANPGAAVDAVG